MHSREWCYIIYHGEETSADYIREGYVWDEVWARSQVTPDGDSYRRLGRSQNVVSRSETETPNGEP